MHFKGPKLSVLGATETVIFFKFAASEPAETDSVFSLAVKNIHPDMLKNKFCEGSENLRKVQKGTGVTGELTDMQMQLVR